MKIIKDILKGNEKLKNSYVALGTFDGVHKGHRVLISEAVKKAKENNGVSVVFTFSNHPLEIIFPERVPKMINTLQEKLYLLEEMGVDYVVLQTFDKEFANCDREKFIDDILVGALGVKEIFVGFNYTFGEKGAGNTEYLKSICKEKNFIVNEVPPVECKGYVLSSTLIRNLILNGELELANHFLGRPFLISEIVEHGKKYGRLLGFPTANLKVVNKVYPPFGIFGGSTSIEGERDKKYSSVINIGKNPTLKPGELSVEVHILDFNEMLYGKRIFVDIEHFMRAEKKFDSFDELKEGIQKDVENWRNYSNGK